MSAPQPTTPQPTTPRANSLASMRRASASFYSSEPRQGSWSNIRRASQGFPAPGDAERRASYRRSSLPHHDDDERIPEEPGKADSENKSSDEELGIGLVHTGQMGAGEMSAGEQKYHRLGWKKLTICLIVEAIALGSLSIPSAFAAVGMVAGVLLTVGIGLLAIYTSHIVGQVRMKYEHVAHYADAVELIWGQYTTSLTLPP